MNSVQSNFVRVPHAYRAGYEKARTCNSRMASRYISHTVVGDPVLDPVMEELAEFPPDELHRFVAAGIDGNDTVLREAPEPLRRFFDNMDPPPWLDHDAFGPGSRVFLENASLFLVAFVCGVLVEGFSTLISKSFDVTDRLAQTDRRLKQNNRHLFEIFLPDGMQRFRDGWKLSARIRFVHARVRHLFQSSGQWDGEAWGTPISAAHLAYAIAVFSMRLLMYAEKVGVTLSEEERQSVIATWRYVGYVMGIPESVLYACGEDALKVHEIGRLCEPRPDAQSISMANALIDAVPRIAGIESRRKQRSAIRLAYRISRALIGSKLANELQFPKLQSFGILPRYRMAQRAGRLLKSESEIISDNVALLIKLSAFDLEGLSYKLPDHAKHSFSSEW